MPLPEDFARESLYAPEAWFVQDATLFPEEQRLEATCDTTRLGPLVDAQRVWPGHDHHFPGAVAIQITGTLGQLYAVYMLDLRPTKGWIGFGTHIRDARFRKIGEIGPPVRCHARLESCRDFRGTLFTTFAFRFEQHGEEIYRSRQTAAWKQGSPD